MKPYVGQIVLYRWRPGQVRAGQAESAGMVTKINPDGTLNLTVHPDATPDPLFLKSVAAASQEVTSHCWSPTEQDARIFFLEERCAQLESDLVDALDRLESGRQAKKKAMV